MKVSAQIVVLIILLSPKGLIAQTSTDDTFFKLKPYKTVCSNTYKVFELNHQANQLAKEGALVSYDANQVAMAEAYSKALAEQVPGSACCAALAKIGYPCGGTSSTVSANTGNTTTFRAEQATETVLNSTSTASMANQLLYDYQRTDKMKAEAKELSEELARLTNELKTMEYAPQTPAQQAVNRDNGAGKINTNSQKYKSRSDDDLKRQLLEEELKLEKLIKEMEKDFADMFRDIFGDLLKIFGVIGGTSSLFDVGKSNLESLIQNVLSPQVTTEEGITRLGNALESQLQQETVSSARNEALNVLTKGIRNPDSHAGRKANLSFNK